MKIKKYRPAFFEGYKEECYEVSTKKELLESELCAGWINDGFKIAFSKGRRCGYLMAVKEAKSEWWVVALIYDEEDQETLSEWLYDFDQLVEGIEEKHE